MVHFVEKKSAFLTDLQLPRSLEPHLDGVVISDVVARHGELPDWPGDVKAYFEPTADSFESIKKRRYLPQELAGLAGVYEFCCITALITEVFKTGFELTFPGIRPRVFISKLRLKLFQTFIAKANFLSGITPTMVANC